MSDIIYLYIGASWVDVSSYVQYFKWEDRGTTALNKLTVSFRQDIKSSYNPTYDVQIRWEHDGTIIFGGKIDKPIGQFPCITVEAYSYGAELIDKFYNKVFENTTPEAIAQDVITNGTELTYGSTTVTGLTISNIPFKDRKRSEVLGILGDISYCRFYTDYNKVGYFEAIGIEDTGLALEVGKNVYEKPEWDYNSDNVVNKVVVEGDYQEFALTTPDTFAGPGTSFTLTQTPSSNLVVTVGGVVKNPYILGSSSGDYTLDAENKKITFTSSVSTVSVTYNYKVRIRIEQISKTTSSRKEGKVSNTCIKSYSEARKIGKKYLIMYGQPKKGTQLKLLGFDARLASGKLITVIDPYELDENGNSINESLMINKLSYDSSNMTTTVTVNTQFFTLFDWQKSVDEKIRALQQENTNQSIVQNYVSFIDKASIKLIEKVIPYSVAVNDSWIVGQAIIGTTKIGERRDGDNFRSYTLGRTLSTHWTITGSASVINNQLSMAASSSAKYIGRNGTGSFLISSGKIYLDYVKGSSASFILYLLYTDANNNYYIEFDHSGNLLNIKKTVSGSVSTVKSIAYTYGSNPIFTIRYYNSEFSIFDASTILTTATDSDITAAGSIILSATGNTVLVNTIKIFKGV
jgi:hypothetical protein